MSDSNEENFSGMSDMDILNQVDDEKPEEESSEPEPEKETESVEEPEEEQESEEEEQESEEEPELQEVNLKSVMEKYPKILKEFPDLRDALKTAEDFKQVFDNTDQAKAAVEQANYYQYFQSKVLEGDAEELFASIKNSGDGEALARFAENILPSLHKVDESLYYKTSAPILQQALYAALKEAESTGVEDLARAAKWIHKFIFGNTNIKAPEFKNKRNNEQQIESERKRLVEEKMNWERQRMSEAMGEVSSSITSELKRMVLKDLDPQGKIQPYIKKKLVEDIISEVGNLLQKDAKHISNMDSLWRRFHQNGMPASGRIRIKDTYLAKAQVVMPGIKSKLRAEALGTKPMNNVQKPQGGAGKNQNQMRQFKSIPSSKKVDYSKTSDLDLIEGRAVLKK